MKIRLLGFQMRAGTENRQKEQRISMQICADVSSGSLNYATGWLQCPSYMTNVDNQNPPSGISCGYMRKTC